ncbi:type III secretion inner membrane ring lipoprotein SctJ (plasmid) [Leisingera sp. S132]|uniref:type III secretion system inner membrane ring lipoprotein SctJ n=1 Tax=Leisingera sp. S132 TaxID=2867016 RepID=UPI0021A3A35B|nr:type III secretion inner membrane ring lipoprotein SctJ [Leisingera sp. S132]UWQ81783.1 type III secretion inner membrane ring lipoprotein SctJ [Leisingera sp. S132]
MASSKSCLRNDEPVGSDRSRVMIRDSLGNLRCWCKLAVFAAAVFLAGCQVELNSNLEEREANEMLSKLLAHGLVASKEKQDGSVTLFVEKSQFGAAVELLNAYGLPRRKFVNMGEVFSTDGLVASPMQEWARFNFALSQELSKSISSLPGVVSAEVHIANPRNTKPFEDPPPPSASVLVVIGEDYITENLIPQIKQLVSFSIENIDYERVGVVLSPVPPPKVETGQMVSFAGLLVHQSSLQTARFLAGAAALLAVIGLAGSFGIFKWLQGRGSGRPAP